MIHEVGGADQGARMPEAYGTRGDYFSGDMLIFAYLNHQISVLK
jgi:hypothetical protein